MTNIVDFKKRVKKPTPNKPPQEPFINLPPVTKYLLLAMVIIYLIVHFALSAEVQIFLFLNFGYIPALWTGQTEYGFHFDLNLILSPITYMFLHANWMHLIMNGAMLMAFGAGVEKWMGGRKFFEFFILCGITAKCRICRLACDCWIAS